MIHIGDEYEACCIFSGSRRSFWWKTTAQVNFVVSWLLLLSCHWVQKHDKWRSEQEPLRPIGNVHESPTFFCPLFFTQVLCKCFSTLQQMWQWNYMGKQFFDVTHSITKLCFSKKSNVENSLISASFLRPCVNMRVAKEATQSWTTDVVFTSELDVESFFEKNVYIIHPQSLT